MRSLLLSEERSQARDMRTCRESARARAARTNSRAKLSHDNVIFGWAFIGPYASMLPDTRNPAIAASRTIKLTSRAVLTIFQVLETRLHLVTQTQPALVFKNPLALVCVAVFITCLKS